MNTATVGVFAAHPVAAAQCSRALEVTGIRVVSNRECFDVGVFDGALPAIDAVLHVARVTRPLMKPILLGAPSDENGCLQWILRGMWGLVPYDRFELELATAVRQVAAGQLWIPPPVLVRLMQADQTRWTVHGDVTLTDRELEVLQLLERRLANKEIASLLRIAERTAKFHVGNILRKLNVKSRQEIFAA